MFALNKKTKKFILGLAVAVLVSFSTLFSPVISTQAEITAPEVYIELPGSNLVYSTYNNITGWYYYKDGVLRSDFTGLIVCAEGNIFISKGWVDTTANKPYMINAAWGAEAELMLEAGYNGFSFDYNKWFYTAFGVFPIYPDTPGTDPDDSSSQEGETQAGDGSEGETKEGETDSGDSKDAEEGDDGVASEEAGSSSDNSSKSEDTAADSGEDGKSDTEGVTGGAASQEASSQNSADVVINGDEIAEGESAEDESESESETETETETETESAKAEDETKAVISTEVVNPTVSADLKNKITAILGKDTTSLTKIQQSILKAAAIQPAAPAGYCATWISDVYALVGFDIGGNANDMWEKYCSSSDPEDLLPGMIVAVQHSSNILGSDGYVYGHVGIYIGDGMIADSHTENGVGTLGLTTLSKWLKTYDIYNTVKWGFPQEVSKTVLLQTPLATPEINVRVISNSKSEFKYKVLVSWEFDENADGYYVYRNGIQIAEIDDPAKVFYVDTEVEEDSIYYYRVASYAYDSKGLYIKKSVLSEISTASFAKVAVENEKKALSKMMSEIEKLNIEETLKREIIKALDTLTFDLERGTSEYLAMALDLYAKTVYLDTVASRETLTLSDDNEDIAEIGGNILELKPEIASKSETACLLPLSENISLVK